MTPQPSRHLAWSLVVALFVAACSSSAADGSGLASLETEPTTVTTEADDEAQTDSEEALLAFASCMREEGIDFPDPSVDADGTIRFGFRRGQASEPGFDPRSEEAREASEKCQEHLEGAAIGPGRGEFDETEIQDTLLAMARCLREEGLDVDDPDLSALGPGSGGGRPFGDLEISDPDVQAALESCRTELGLGDGVRIGGGPGRGPGAAGD